MEKNDTNEDSKKVEMDDNKEEKELVAIMLDACGASSSSSSNTTTTTTTTTTNIDTVRHLIVKNRMLASLQDDVTGKSPLMVAAECGNTELCTMLLEAGAPWNAIDRMGQCAGNYATHAQHWDVVNLLVNAGTRAELILGASIRLQQQRREQEQEQQEQQLSSNNNINSKKETTTTTTAAAAASASTTTTTTTRTPVEHEPCTKPDYLHRGVRYNSSKTALLDDDNDAIMMEWERPLMEAHAQILMQTGGEDYSSSSSKNKNTNNRSVLNVGFGMGIIDTALQAYQPSLHIIIEAHPTVYQQMLQDDWDKKPNIRICFGKWQDILPKLISQEKIKVDSVFYDTYGEHFMDLEDFHSILPSILSKSNGIYSYFNGLAPDNIFFHGVACQCIKVQLEQKGFEVEFVPCEILQNNNNNEKVWEGIRRKYWHGRDSYYIPRITWKTNDKKKNEDKAKQQQSNRRTTTTITTTTTTTQEPKKGDDNKPNYESQDDSKISLETDNNLDTTDPASKRLKKID